MYLYLSNDPVISASTGAISGVYHEMCSAGGAGLRGLEFGFPLRLA